MSNILGNMPPVFGSGYRGVVPAPSAADVSAQNILRADGTWGAGPSGTLPSQTGNGGKLLTTDGTNASWASSLNTFQFGDVTLGTSGPSVKSTLSARAPRQGLVFDGTSVATVGTISAFGTSDFSASAIIVPKSSVGAQQTVFMSAAGGFYLAIKTDGTIGIAISGTGFTVSSTVAVAFDKASLITYTRSGTTGTFYINGVSAGTATDTNNYSQPINQLNYSGSVQLFGLISGIAIYNRALSASEVVALYEAGAPSGADYNSASNTSLTIGTFNGANVSSASSTGFTYVLNGAGYAVSNYTFALSKGQRLRLTGTLTLNGGKTVLPQFYLDGTASAFATITSAGAFSVELTCPTGPTGYIVVYANGDANYTISGLTVTRLGLLLAPDAAQAGGGLVWYDTSGNAANITLPASGVSWNVPSSQKTASGWTYNGTLSVVNTSTTGILKLQGANGYSSTEYYNASAVRKWTTGYDGSNDNYYWAAADGSTAAVVKQSGNLLIGTPIDGGNGKLQLADHTTSAGGIGFGPKTSLYRYGITTLGLQQNSGSYKPLYFYADVTNCGVFDTPAAEPNYSGIYFNSTANSATIATKGTVALTLDSSQNATFAGRSSATTAYGTAKSVTVDFATSTATNVTRTFTVTIPSPGLAGTFLLEVGVYGNGATGLGSLLVKGYGYFGSTSLYDATEISKVSTGNVTVSSITKGNGSFTFTVLDTTSSALVAVKYSQTSDAAITTLPTITSA